MLSYSVAERDRVHLRRRRPRAGDHEDQRYGAEQPDRQAEGDQPPVQRQVLGRAVQGLGAGVVIVLGAVGVYLGRYLRFNSWDVRHPASMLRKLVAHLRQRGKALEAGGFVLTHALLIALLYVPLFSLAWTALL